MVLLRVRLCLMVVGVGGFDKEVVIGGEVGVGEEVDFRLFILECFIYVKYRYYFIEIILRYFYSCFC